jgi:hypothetical protein
MRRMLTLVLMLMPLTATADVGNHLHPHGISYGWVIAGAIGLAAGWVVARMRK